MNNMTSIKTNGVFLRDNAELLQLHMRTAKLTICLDADLEIDNAFPCFALTHFRHEEIEVIRYHRTRLERKLTLHSDEHLFVQSIVEELKAGRKVAIGCRLKKRALM